MTTPPSTSDDQTQAGEQPPPPPPYEPDQALISEGKRSEDAPRERR